MTSALAFCFDLVTTMAQRQLCETAQTSCCKGFYGELREVGALACSFLPPPLTLGERLARYLSVNLVSITGWRRWRPTSP